MRTATRRVSVVATVVLAGCLAGPAAHAQSGNPLIGTWKLNRAKSTFNPGPAPASRTMKFLPAGDGIKHVIETFVNNASGTDEGVHLTEYTASFDGKDYAIQGSALERVSLRRVNARSFERTGKVGGEVTETQTWSLSADGRVLTVKTNGASEAGEYSRVEVFEKQ